MEKEARKEIQERIIPLEGEEEVHDDELSAIIKLVSPGTALRTALDGALKTGRGALIVVENDNVLPIIDGGFEIHCRFTPQKLIELCKMDGAIILSKDMKKINYANVTLAPSSKIETAETGTRHKAAERTAKQTFSLVIAISERKNEITLFYKDIKYPIKSTDELLRKSNEHIQILEKQKETFDINKKRLNHLELQNHSSIDQAVNAIQRGKIIEKISQELEKTMIELGKEGSLLKARLKELTRGVKKETNLIIKDYTRLDVQKSKILLDTLAYDEIIDSENILRALAQENSSNHQIKGWRILSKTSLSDSEINKLVKETGNLQRAVLRMLEDEQAKSFEEDLNKIKLD